MPTKYTDRLNLPINGHSDIYFYTLNGLLIAKGYQQIVFHKKIPYIEFNECGIFQENIHIPDSKKWRLKHLSSQYVEYRSKDYCNIKIIQWKINNELTSKMFYISPFDLKSDKIPVLISPLRRKHSLSNLFERQKQ